VGYSQFGEDDVVVEFFSKRPIEGKRRFLDVGAHDGISCSNSRWLAELGWEGTLVEPSPAAFQKLMQVYADRPDVNLLNVGLIPECMRVVKFYESGGLFVGTFDEKHRDEWEGKQHVHYRPIYVAGVDWESLFSALPGPYHFISIDVEGTNVELFKMLALESSGAEMVCVEHQGRIAEILAIAEPQGFSLYHTTEANVLLARR
jgi:FkbM family methyltransferase